MSDPAGTATIESGPERFAASLPCVGTVEEIEVNVTDEGMSRRG